MGRDREIREEQRPYQKRKGAKSSGGEVEDMIKDSKTKVKIERGIKMSYDSTADTLKHIKRVNELLIFASTEILKRAVDHDETKLSSLEREGFDEYTPKLKDCTYGSDEYKRYLSELNKTLSHHYENNSHHPEHYKNGINDFDLFDLIEMLFDWKAATERHADGDIYKSIKINKERFGLSDQLELILEKTARRYLRFI